jgi:hypothetical protein
VNAASYPPPVMGGSGTEVTTEYLIQRGGGIGPVKPRQPSR